jgi:hypothetical protein
LRPDAIAGEFNVAAATDDRYTASTIFTVRRHSGRLETTADDVGMIGGHVRRTSDALVREGGSTTSSRSAASGRA